MRTLIYGLLALPVIAGAESNFIDSMSISAGLGQDDIEIVRIGVQKKLNRILYSNDSFDLTTYFDLSFNHWNSNINSLNAVAFSPVLVLDFGKSAGGHAFKPYLEGGVGVAYISNKFIGPRNMSSSFQFEDRFGVGVRSDKYDLKLNVFHYSNAGIKQPNSGLTMGMGTFTYNF